MSTTTNQTQESGAIKPLNKIVELAAELQDVGPSIGRFERGECESIDDLLARL